MNVHSRLRPLVVSLMLGIAGSLFAVRPANAVPQAQPDPGFQANSGAHGRDRQPDADPIIGTWVMTVIADGPDAPPPFPQFLTFNEGGTAMQSASGPPIPALGNPGHGVWKRVGRHTIAATFVQMTFDETLQRNGGLKLTILATLNERTQTLTSVDQATIYDLDGNEIVTLTGTETGRRLRVEVIR